MLILQTLLLLLLFYYYYYKSKDVIAPFKKVPQSCCDLQHDSHSRKQECFQCLFEVVRCVGTSGSWRFQCLFEVVRCVGTSGSCSSRQLQSCGLDTANARRPHLSVVTRGMQLRLMKVMHNIMSTVSLSLTVLDTHAARLMSTASLSLTVLDTHAAQVNESNAQYHVHSVRVSQS